MCLKKLIFSNCVCITFCIVYVPVNSNTAHCPPHPGHLTGVLLRTVENLTQNEAHQVGHLTVVSKRWSASQANGFCYCFRIQHDCAPRSRPGHSSYIHCFVGAFCEPFEKPVKCELSGINNFIEINKPSYDSFRRL